MSGTFVRSTLILTIATLISKILGSVFRIPLQNIAGDEVLGIFTLVYPVYMTALILSVAGIPIAISQLISKARVENDQEEIRNIFVTSSILAVLFGLFSFSLLTGLSEQLAQLLGGPKTRLSIIIVSITLLIAPYMAIYRGFFQGHENMEPTAFSQVIEQLIRVALVIIIAYYTVNMDFSNEIVAGGVMVGSSIGALLSLVYLRYLFQKSPFKPYSEIKYSLKDFKTTSRKILKVSLPICVGALTMALLNVVDSLSIPFSLKMAGGEGTEINYQYGLYGRGLSLVQIATVFSTSIVLPLIPLISKHLTQKEFDTTNKVIVKSQNLAHLFSWPAAIGLLALALPLNLGLFTDLNGSLVLALIGLSSVFTSLTVLGTGILQGLEESKIAAWIIVFGALMKVLLNFIFIQLYGLVGAAISTLIIYILLWLTNAYFIWKQTKVKLVTRETFVHLGSSILMGLVIGIPTLLFNIQGWDRINALLYSFGAAGIGAVIYIFMVIMFKGISTEELIRIPGANRLIRKKSRN
ncbi:putative polysaccharide biosynthesis protein [Pseudalkalibacillus salsuginis]|uniref:putative polysaccharide biosynthesis protein n=1 Tax=Pseudalkalibacillus salsuginis TaxID=2910972 RepID=UPI001F2D5EA3|nr:polysaccharide biosynthesis protein [Pseudalkalibacillus salsuginis]MCF6410111.1 polysaccharide biosynthesis protein [Pseudalkalibacillus salsuginis]